MPSTPFLDFEAQEHQAVAYVDGGSHGNPGEAGYGVHVLDTKGNSIRNIYGYLGIETNNVAEYSGLIAALEFALENKITSLSVFSDSELMVRQLKGIYQVKNQKLKELHSTAKGLIKKLRRFKIKHVPREQNKEADRLAAMAIKNKKTASLGQDS